MSTLARSDAERRSRKSNSRFRAAKGSHTVVSNSSRESPMALDFPGLTFSTSVCLDMASEIRYNIHRRMRERKVLVTVIHDFPTERRTAYPQSLKEATRKVHERTEGRAFVIFDTEDTI